MAFNADSVAILVSQILHFVSAKYFGIWLSIWYCSVSHVASRKKSSIFLVCEALVNLVSEKHNFSSWLRRELATLPTDEKTSALICCIKNFKFWSATIYESKLCYNTEITQWLMVCEAISLRQNLSTDAVWLNTLVNNSKFVPFTRTFL